MKNWRTTTAAVISTIAAFVAFSPDSFGGESHSFVRLCLFIHLGGLAAFGILAKDASNDKSNLFR
jgi:hypothetical protein